jgi:protein tyrosine/serine phosphatase
VTDYQPLHLDWPGLVNVRDLGGLPVDGGTVRDGALIRSESLTRLDAAARHVLREAGVSRIVDLRRPNESPEVHPFADEASYVNLPVEDPADDKGAAETMGDVYVELLDARPDLFAAALGAIADAPPGAVLVHCAAGKDRTGVVTALALSIAGAEPEVVAADYALTGARLRAYVEEEVATIEDEQQRERYLRYQATPEAFMFQVIDHLDATYGGVAAYLRSGGMTDEQLTALRRRLVG